MVDICRSIMGSRITFVTLGLTMLIWIVAAESKIKHINDFPNGFDELPVEDYPLPMESNRPDDVDNEAIEKLVNEFLNKGTIEQNIVKKNKEAQALINSSSYWNIKDVQPTNSITNTTQANEWLAGYAKEWTKVLRQVAIAGWNYFATASPITRNLLTEAENVARQFLKASVQQAQQFDVDAVFAGDEPEARMGRAQMELILKQGTNALTDEDLKIYNSILRRINHLFTGTSICDMNASRNTPCIIKYSDYLSVLLTAGNADNQLRWWASWRASIGANMTDAYTNLITISNKAAKLNGHDNLGAMWRSAYETDDFVVSEQIERCYQQIKPFYQELHSYIRVHLASIFNGNTESGKITRDGLIPVHLLKSLNGESWISYYEQTKPFADWTISNGMGAESDSGMIMENTSSRHDDARARRDDSHDHNVHHHGDHEHDHHHHDDHSSPQPEAEPEPEPTTGGEAEPQPTPKPEPEPSAHNGESAREGGSVNIAEKMLEQMHAQNYTSMTLFTKAYRYLKYLGFEQLPASVWNSSIFSRNWSKDMICQPATAYDMISSTKQPDLRIKVCAQLSEPDFVNAHRLFIQLYYKYLTRQKTILLRDSPNPSLSNALSAAFGVLATNLDYLKGLKLIGEDTMLPESKVINCLYREAIDQFVPLPFNVVADKWRFAVFEGQLTSSNWAAEWWKLREQYQGLKAPSKEALDKLINDRDASESVYSAAEIASVNDWDAVASPLITQQHAPASRNFISYVLQFQILKYLCPDTPADQLHQGCIPAKQTVQRIINAMSKGASIPWTQAMEEMTGSKNLDASALIEYYQPLLKWMKKANENRVKGWMDAKDEPFQPNELPLLRKSTVDEHKNFIPADEQIAYPGFGYSQTRQNCASGQECLLDSVCNGTTCVCREGLFTLQIADTYNCVPGNPANIGFADEDGGLVIALNPTNTTTNGTGVAVIAGGNGLPIPATAAVEVDAMTTMTLPASSMKPVNAAQAFGFSNLFALSVAMTSLALIHCSNLLLSLH